MRCETKPWETMVGVVVFGQLIMVHRAMFIFRCVSTCLPMQKCGIPPNLARMAASSSSSSSQPPTSSSSLPGPPVFDYLYVWNTITMTFGASFATCPTEEGNTEQLTLCTGFISWTCGRPSPMRDYGKHMLVNWKIGSSGNNNCNEHRMVIPVHPP